MIHVTIYNLSVALQTDEQKLIDIVETFIRRHYTVKGGVHGATAQPDTEFVSRLSLPGVYFLHINQFRHLLHHLTEVGYSITHCQREDMRDYNIKTEDYRVREGWVLRDDQQPVSDFISDNPSGSKLVSLQTGKGKAQTLTSRIKVPGGWTTFAAVSVGDTVTTAQGLPATVVGVYPQGVTKVHRVIFEDGRYTTASGEHLWKVKRTGSNRDNGWAVLTTQQLSDSMQNLDVNHYVQLCESEKIPYVDLPIAAYMYARLVARCFRDSIPEEYLNASHAQRCDLIRGLLDGSCSHQYSQPILEYTARSVAILNNLQYLVRSIGGIASHRPGSLTLNIVVDSIDIIFSRCDERAPQERLLRLVAIVPAGMEATTCIAIDHPEHLYVTDDFIVTHNTFIALNALAKVGKRIAVVILPTFTDKWIQDIITIHEATPADIMVVQGSASLRALAHMAKDAPLDSRYLIFSESTLAKYIRDYEKSPEQSVEIYGIHPVDLFPLLQIGTVLVDETHMHFHAIFKILLHCNVKLQVGLSATLMSDDGVVSMVHRIVYPPKVVYEIAELDAYSDVYALSYSLSHDLIRKIKTTNYGSNSYAHTAYEQSVMRYAPLLRFYYGLIDNVLRDFYVDRYEEGDRCLIFVASIKLATKLTERYVEMYPDKVVRRYCDGDPPENLVGTDLIITTIMSAGTGLDIPNLRVVIQTVSVASPVPNIQNLGRLRKLKGGKDTRFCYIYAENIPKQRQYHYRRIELFRGRVASHQNFRARTSP